MVREAPTRLGSASWIRSWRSRTSVLSGGDRPSPVAGHPGDAGRSSAWRVAVSLIPEPEYRVRAQVLTTGSTTRSRSIFGGNGTRRPRPPGHQPAGVPQLVEHAPRGRQRLHGSLPTQRDLPGRRRADGRRSDREQDQQRRRAVAGVDRSRWPPPRSSTRTPRPTSSCGEAHGPRAPGQDQAAAPGAAGRDRGPDRDDPPAGDRDRGAARGGPATPTPLLAAAQRPASELQDQLDPLEAAGSRDPHDARRHQPRRRALGRRRRRGAQHRLGPRHPGQPQRPAQPGDRARRRPVPRGRRSPSSATTSTTRSSRRRWSSKVTGVVDARPHPQGRARGVRAGHRLPSDRAGGRGVPPAADVGEVPRHRATGAGGAGHEPVARRGQDDGGGEPGGRVRAVRRPCRARRRRPAPAAHGGDARRSPHPGPDRRAHRGRDPSPGDPDGRRGAQPVGPACWLPAPQPVRAAERRARPAADRRAGADLRRGGHRLPAGAAGHRLAGAGPHGGHDAARHVGQQDVEAQPHPGGRAAAPGRRTAVGHGPQQPVGRRHVQHRALPLRDGGQARTGARRRTAGARTRRNGARAQLGRRRRSRRRVGPGRATTGHGPDRT